MKNYIQTSIPDSLEESAKLDGCNDIGILVKIVLPLSKPILATIALFFAVGRWNGFSGCLLLHTEQKPVSAAIEALLSGKRRPVNGILLG
jgi:putative aldouronate transport system permease protein